MNVTLLQSLADKFRRLPEIVDMNYWAVSRLVSEEVPCGTVGCIAGHALVEARGAEYAQTQSIRCQSIMTDIGLERPSRMFDDYARTYFILTQAPVPHEARELLGLSEAQALRLFFTDYWPEYYRSDYEDEDGDQSLGRITADRIEHFIETEGEE